jgi:hypothetical protein
MPVCGDMNIDFADASLKRFKLFCNMYLQSPVKLFNICCDNLFINQGALSLDRLSYRVHSDRLTDGAERGDSARKRSSRVEGFLEE